MNAVVLCLRTVVGIMWMVIAYKEALKDHINMPLAGVFIA
jgi:hypothetical protein